MILIASRATRGVKILNRKQTRDELITLFKAQMHKLMERLNVRIYLYSVNPFMLINLLCRVNTFPGKLV